jgi:hypothetical protein
MPSVMSNRIYLRLVFAGCCCGAGMTALPACAEPANVRDDPALARVGGAALLAMNFDLAGRDRAEALHATDAEAASAEEAETEAGEGALEAPAMPRQPWVDDGLKREWSIRPVEDGPALELAALGGGQKKSGRLAHVRVSWAF